MQRKYEKYDKHQERAYRNYSHLENEYDDYYEGNLYEPQDLRQRIEENRRSKQSLRPTTTTTTAHGGGGSGGRDTAAASNYHHGQPYQRYSAKYQSPDDRNYEKYDHHSRHTSRNRDEKGVDRHKESSSSKETHVKSERIVVKDNEVKRSKIEAEVFEVVSDEEGELKSDDNDNKSESGRNQNEADDKTPKDNYHDVSPVSSKEFTPNSSKRSTSASKSDADDADESSKKSKSSENVSGDEGSNDSKKSEKSEKDGGNKGGKKRRSSSSSSSNNDDSVKKKKSIDYKKASDKMEGYMEYEQEIYEEESEEEEIVHEKEEETKSDEESMSEEEEGEEKDEEEKEGEEIKEKNEENKVENEQKEQEKDEAKLAAESIDDIDKMDEEPLYNCAIYGCRSVEEYECLNKIEEGSYGVVFRAKDKKTNEIVALKRLKMEKEREGFPITSLREVDTLLKAQHPNIVTVREIVVGSNMDKIYMVMDYVEHDLKSLMQYSMKKPFKINEVKTLMQQLLRGVAHLHDNWIIHRDLKTSNLLLSHSGILKIADFGLAREYGSPLKEYTPIVVTLWYRSVELLLGVKKYSIAVDMWSVGAIFGELLLMKALFQGKGEMDQLNKIFKDLGTPNEKIWPKFKEMPLARSLNFPNFPYNTLRSRFNKFSISDLGFDLLTKLLTYDPERRINAENALKHEYFRETPLPIDVTLFPTWPAKSEGMVKKHVSDNEPKAPSAGKKYEELISEDAFVLQQPIAAGFQLK